MAFFLGLTLILWGCGGEAPKPAKVPMPPMAKKAPIVTPAKKPFPLTVELKAEFPPLEKYTYNPRGKPDPFRPLIVEKTEIAPKKVAEKAMVEAGATPLERMDLGQFKLVAIIWDIRDPKAMVEDKGGNGYILSKGTAIGKNHGRVTDITPEAVVVAERYEPHMGKFKTREVPLKLHGE